MLQIQATLNEITHKTSVILDKQCKEKDNNIKKFMDEKNKINKNFISYKIEFWKNNKNKKWATDVIILAKKFFCITPYAQRYNINKKNLIYYCNKHRKRSVKNNEKSFCYSKVIYNRNEEEFYLIYNIL